MLLVKLYGFQICRAISYIHTLGVCHRDIKPQNLLVDPQTHVLKLCDFGSAKMLSPGESNIAYICSRYYRAPELIFGATEYTPTIDIWSVGCVLAELMIGRPLFAGESGVDQLVEIIKVCVLPTCSKLRSIVLSTSPARLSSHRLMLRSGCACTLAPADSRAAGECRCWARQARRTSSA